MKDRKIANAIRIDEKWCKRCGICVEFCPRNVLFADKEQNIKVKDLENCNLCRFCEMRCPDYAIIVEGGIS